MHDTKFYIYELINHSRNGFIRYYVSYYKVLHHLKSWYYYKWHEKDLELEKCDVHAVKESDGIILILSHSEGHVSSKTKFYHHTSLDD